MALTVAEVRRHERVSQFTVPYLAQPVPGDDLLCVGLLWGWRHPLVFVGA